MATHSTLHDHFQLETKDPPLLIIEPSRTAPGTANISIDEAHNPSSQVPARDAMNPVAPDKEYLPSHLNSTSHPSIQASTSQYSGPRQRTGRARALSPTMPPSAQLAPVEESYLNPKWSNCTPQQPSYYSYQSRLPDRVSVPSDQLQSLTNLPHLRSHQQYEIHNPVGPSRSAQGLMRSLMGDLKDDPDAWIAIPIETETDVLRDENPYPGLRVQAQHMRKHQLFNPEILIEQGVISHGR